MATFGLSLGLPSTDHDTDMLSDAARSDIDFDIDVEVPLGTGDQDDYMADSFDTEAAVEAFADAKDAEMIEEYDDQRVNEAEMYDGDLEEDDQMDNIDFDRPAQPTDSALVFFSTIAEAPGQEQVVDFNEWPTESHLDQPNTTDDDPGEGLGNITVDADLSNSQSQNDISNRDEEANSPKANAQNSPSPLRNPVDDVKKVHESNSLPEDSEANIAHLEDSETGNEYRSANPEAETDHVDDPEEDVITYDDEDEAESLHTTPETTAEQQLATAENIEIIDNIQQHELNNDEQGADHKEEHFQEDRDLIRSEKVSDQTKREEDEHDEQSAEQSSEEQTLEQHENENFQDYSYDVIVEYGGTQLSLFPPSRPDLPETYLLQDHSLAEKSLAELFAACREVLGNSITDRDALEIEVSAFGLYIHEDSSECPALSISQVVDVYFRLNENDGVEEPHPLTLTLKTRRRFAARLSFLFEAADAAKGFTTLNGPNGQHRDNVGSVDEQDLSRPKYETVESRDFGNEFESRENWDTEAAEADVIREELFVEAETAGTNDSEETFEPSYAPKTASSNGSEIEHVDPTHVEPTEVINAEEDVDEDKVEKELEDGDLIDYLDEVEEEGFADSGRSSTIEGDSAQVESETLLDDSNGIANTIDAAQPDNAGGLKALSASRNAPAIINENTLQRQAQEETPVAIENIEKLDDSATEALMANAQLGKEEDILQSNELLLESENTDFEKTNILPEDQSSPEEGVVDDENGSNEWHGEETTVSQNEVADEPDTNVIEDPADLGHDSGEVQHDEFEINIGWDDEEEELEPYNKSESPLGKRNFDEHAEGVADGKYDQEVKRIKST